MRRCGGHHQNPPKAEGLPNFRSINLGGAQSPVVRNSPLHQRLDRKIRSYNCEVVAGLFTPCIKIGNQCVNIGLSSSRAARPVSSLRQITALIGKSCRDWFFNDECYVSSGLTATRAFLAAARKTLGFSLCPTQSARKSPCRRWMIGRRSGEEFTTQRATKVGAGGFPIEASRAARHEC